MDIRDLTPQRRVWAVIQAMRMFGTFDRRRIQNLILCLVKQAMKDACYPIPKDRYYPVTTANKRSAIRFLNGPMPWLILCDIDEGWLRSIMRMAGII